MLSFLLLNLEDTIYGGREFTYRSGNMNVANISSWYMKHVKGVLPQLLVKENHIGHVDVHEPERKFSYKNDLTKPIFWHTHPHGQLFQLQRFHYAVQLKCCGRSAIAAQN